MFVQAAVEDLPEEFDGVADEIHIHFPWGSLLGAVATGDKGILRSLRRIAASGCMLEIIVGIDPERDRSEVERLGVPDLTPVFTHSFLVAKYRAAGFELLKTRTLERAEWSKLNTSWAGRLGTSTSRVVKLLAFEAI